MVVSTKKHGCYHANSKVVSTKLFLCMGRLTPINDLESNAKNETLPCKYMSYCTDIFYSRVEVTHIPPKGPRRRDWSNCARSSATPLSWSYVSETCLSQNTWMYLLSTHENSVSHHSFSIILR